MFISVTTLPAAGNCALALVFGRFHEAGGAALQLLINLTGIVISSYLVLLAVAAPAARASETTAMSQHPEPRATHPGTSAVGATAVRAAEPGGHRNEDVLARTVQHDWYLP